MNVNFDFNTPPADNVAFMLAKKPKLSFDYDEIKFEAHQRAFTVAKVTQIELLAEIQESLENAFIEGQSYQTWLKNLKPTLEKRGWLGATSVTNPKTGETKDIFVGARRLKRIKGDTLFLMAKSAKILQRVGTGEPQIECEIIDDTPPICKFCGAKLRARLEKMEGVCRACNGDFVDESLLRACGKGWRKKRFANF